MRIPYLDELAKFRVKGVPLGAALLMEAFEGLNDGFGAWVGDFVGKKFGYQTRAYYGSRVAVPIVLSLIAENVKAVRSTMGDTAADVFGIAAAKAGVGFAPGAVKGKLAPTIEGWVSSKIFGLLAQIKTAGTPKIAGTRTIGQIPQEYKGEMTEILGTRGRAGAGVAGIGKYRTAGAGGGISTIGYVSEVERRARMVRI